MSQNWNNCLQRLVIHTGTTHTDIYKGPLNKSRGIEKLTHVGKRTPFESWSLKSVPFFDDEPGMKKVRNNNTEGEQSPIDEHMIAYNSLTFEFIIVAATRYTAAAVIHIIELFNKLWRIFPLGFTLRPLKLLTFLFCLYSASMFLCLVGSSLITFIILLQCALSTAD